MAAVLRSAGMLSGGAPGGALPSRPAGPWGRRGSAHASLSAQPRAKRQFTERHLAGAASCAPLSRNGCRTGAASTARLSKRADEPTLASAFLPNLGAHMPPALSSNWLSSRKGAGAATSAASAASSNQFVKPRHIEGAPEPCQICQDTGSVGCSVCQGRGWLPKGGYHRRNPVNLNRIVGSKWTAMERTFGWRHFRVKSKRKAGDKQWFVEMVATCDENTQFWVNAQNLKDRARWSMGWLQKNELAPSLPDQIGQRSDEDSGDGANAAPASALTCKACQGTGQVPCKPCTSKGNPGTSANKRNPDTSDLIYVDNDDDFVLINI